MLAPGWVAIFDDDTSVCASLTRLLRCSGIRARSFGSAEEYLRRLGDDAPGCVLLDLHLRGETNGLDLMDRLGITSNGIAVIVISGASHTPVQLQRGNTAGTMHLRTPFDPNVLVERVLACLGREARH